MVTNHSYFAMAGLDNISICVDLFPELSLYFVDSFMAVTVWLTFYIDFSLDSRK